MKNIRTEFKVDGDLVVTEINGRVRAYNPDIDYQQLYFAARHYAEEDNFVWPAGIGIPDDVLRAIFIRSEIGSSRRVAPLDAVDRVRDLLVQKSGGQVVFGGPIAALDLSDVDQSLVERFPGWAARLWDEVGAVTFDEFEAAQDSLPEDGTDEELFPFLVAQLSGGLYEEGEKEPDEVDVEATEGLLEAVRRLSAQWQKAVGPMAYDRKFEVRLAPYGAAAFLWSRDGERLMRLPLEEVVDRDADDLARIVAWLDSPLGYEAADDYEDGYTHILIWPEPYECEDARHVPDDLFPWDVEKEED